jgi:hypothetical protein
LRTEAALGYKLTEYPLEKDEVMVFKPRVEEAQRIAKNEMKKLQEEQDRKKKKKRKAGSVSARDDMDAEEG